MLRGGGMVAALRLVCINLTAARITLADEGLSHCNTMTRLRANRAGPAAFGKGYRL